MGGRGFLVAERQHGVLEGEEGIGGDDEMPGKPVGRTVHGRLREHGRIPGEGTDEVVAVGYVTGVAGAAERGGVAGEGLDAGVGVPDTEEGIALPLNEVVAADPGPVVRGGVQQGPAGGVGAEGVGSAGAGTGRRLTGRTYDG